MGDVACHQLVQLVGGEGVDDHAKLALLVEERGEERKEHLLEGHERWRQAELGADDGRKELVQLLHQPFLLQKLSSHADGAWQAVHGGVLGVHGGVLGVHGGVLGVVWVCGHGARSGCSDGSRSHGQEYFAVN